MMKERLFQYKRDLPDPRDYLYKNKFQVLKTPPATVDLRPYCPTIEDQGNLGSCTGNAIVGALEILQNRSSSTFKDMSRLFVYYNERLIEGTINEDSGAYLRDGIKSVANYGVCTETSWPYNISKYAVKPTDSCYTEALNYKILEYYRLTTLTEMKSCLTNGRPFVFGFTVYSSFVSSKVAKTGIVPMPLKKEQILGGHAVVAVGYESNNRRFIVRNSWGSSWGIKGYFYMPFDYLLNPNLASDFWMIVK